MISRLLCRVLGHRINRRRVRHDGVFFRTTCTRCEEKLVRDTGGWRPESLINDVPDYATPQCEGPAE